MNGQSFMTSVRHQMNIFLGALMFLTRIPVGKQYVFCSKDLPRSIIYFPIVGLIVGMLGGLVLFCAERFVPPVLAVLLCMGVTVAVTGALHEDGLADTADGLIGGFEPQRRLEIMKDSRIGSYGAVVLWFSLTAKLFLLTALLEKGVFAAVCGLVVAHGLGRAATVTLKELVIALLAPILLSLALLGSKAVLPLIVTAAVTWGAGVYFQKKIGGITGDCLGSANQLVELVCYLSLVARLPAATA